MPNMTANEMIPAVNATIGVRFESLIVMCRVLDVKCSYGKPRLQVKAINGYGTQWIELSRVHPAYMTNALTPSGLAPVDE